MTGMTVRNMIEEALGTSVKTVIVGDNLAALRNLEHEVCSWRTRHYSVPAAWIRNRIKEDQVEVRHRAGVSLTADGLTKVLQGTALKKTRLQLTLRNGKEDDVDLQQYARNW